MSSRGRGSSGSPSDDGALRMTVEESQRTFDKQVATLEEIDDKAMRTVRTAVIVLGFVVSALGISGPEAIDSLSWIPLIIGGSGAGALVVAVIWGVGTYSVTQYPTGIGGQHRHDVISGGYSESQWSVEMLNEYSRWSAELREEINQNEEYLETVQFSLILGVLCLLLASFLLVVKSKLGFPPWQTTLFLVLVVAGAGLSRRLMLRRS